MSQSDPMISIITPSYNQAAYIEQTIDSVLRQDCAHVEHIVIDGGSTDGTVDILNRYPHLIWRSQKDRGQADALNKGLALAKGQIIGWINSDDYYHENIFGSVIKHLQATDSPWVVGRQADVFDNGSLILFKDSPKVTFDTLVNNPDIVKQQATFFKKDALISVGGWNVDCYMVMDFDLWVRLARIAPPVMVDEDWAYFRNHGAQKSSHGNVLRQSREIAAVLRREGVSPSVIAFHKATKYWWWAKGVAKEHLINMGVVPERYRTRSVRQ